MHAISHEKIGSVRMAGVGARDTDVLSGVMFAMRSVPPGATGEEDDILSGAMFAMRSQPVDHHCPDSGERA